jgi:hypothetical protein
VVDDERTDEADGLDRPATSGTRAGALLEDDATTPSRPDAATSARVDAWLLGAASTGRRANGPGRSRSRARRGRVLAVAGAVVVIGGVIGIATRDKGQSAAPTGPGTTVVRGTAGTVVGVGTTLAPTVAATTVAATTVAATTAAPTTAPATSSSTVAATTTVAPAPAALSGELLYQSLVDGTYPTGQSWPHGVLTGGEVVVTGVVPDQATKDKVIETLRFAPAAATVVNSLTIDPTVPAPPAVLWTILDVTIFEPGSAQLVFTAGDEVPKGDTVIALWAKRLSEVADARAIVVVRRDGSGDAVALDRADAIKSRFKVTDDSLHQVTVALTKTASTGSQVAFALAMAP